MESGGKKTGRDKRQEVRQRVFRYQLVIEKINIKKRGFRYIYGYLFISATSAEFTLGALGARVQGSKM